MTVNALTMYEDKSFWARDYGPYIPNPALQESIKVDVAVVGGGFMGLNTAREFKKDNPNARLAVLEGEVIGNGASGRNAGFNMTLFGLEPQVTRLRWGKQRTVEAYRYMVKAVNYTDRPFKLDLRLTGSRVSADAVVRIREIASSLTAECTAEQPALFEPRECSAKNSGGLVHELAPHSVAVIEFRNP